MLFVWKRIWHHWSILGTKDDGDDDYYGDDYDDEVDDDNDDYDDNDITDYSIQSFRIKLVYWSVSDIIRPSWVLKKEYYRFL
jgi:hypothetical protein